MYGYFLSCSYEGRAYAGSQRQSNTELTVETQLELAFARVLPDALRGGRLVFSSRTDAGVHALANVFSFTLPEKVKDSNRLLTALNAVLPEDIAVYDLRELSTEAHARFSAISRRYRYNLHTRKMPFARNNSWFYPYALRPELLQKMASVALGIRNFASFSKKHSNVKSYNCNLLEATWNFSEYRISLELVANRFLRGMVRALVGTMLYLDRRGYSLADFQELLDKPILASAPMWSPAIGLTLVEVNYPSGLWL